MRKLFPIVLSGVLVVSFSQLAAAQSTTVQGNTGAAVGADVNTKAPSADTKATGSADTKADVKIGSDPKDAKIGSDSRAGAGATSSTDIDKNAKPKDKAKAKKNKDKQSSAGDTMNKQTPKADKDAAAAGGSSAPGTSSSTSTQSGAGASNSLPTKPDASAAPQKSDSTVKSGEQSPKKSEKSY